MSRIAGVAVLAVLASPALAEPIGPRINLVQPWQGDPSAVPNIIDSHTLYLNNCKPSGCKITVGNTDARTLTSDIPNTNSTLSAFSGSDSQWGAIRDCVKQVMAPLNVTVTDQKPASGDYFEVVIAGDPTQMGLPCGSGGCVLGIADYLCQNPQDCGRKYIPDALVFDFANTAGTANTTLVCGTAAQEIAHAWTLDHSTPATDPMTYNNYATPLKFQDGAPCGSDCLYMCPSGTGTCNAFGVTCTNNRHTCMSTGQATQDEVTILTNLLGPAGAVAPTLSITKPTDGSGVQAGGEIDVNCTSSDGVSEVDFVFDGIPNANLTAAPYTFTVPANAKDGAHTIRILCASNKSATSDLTETVLVGAKCGSDSDCNPNYICYDGACVAGPMAMGGLGAACASNTDCQSGTCVGYNNTMTCVVPCDTSNAHCPGGFGCVGTGTGTSGECIAGADTGGGCCDSGRTPPGGALMLGAIAALWITRRRRARAF
ncbi:MAG: Ig-like domain-containing protein [Acidobacteriota bacterium]